MASELLINNEDAWNDIFLTRDFDGNEDQVSEDRSDSDYDADFAGMPQLPLERICTKSLAEESFQFITGLARIISSLSSSILPSLCENLV